MFRRPLRRAMMRQAVRPAVPPMLRRAHELMEAGDYPAAAEAFEQLARAGEARGHPKAGQMYLQAGRARILAGQKEAGFAHLKRGLGLMSAFPGQLLHVGRRVVGELNAQGLSAEAQEIAQWLEARLPVRPETAGGAFAAPARKPILPTHCPGCGGPVRADEVEWLDDLTAECTWCGSPVRAEA